MAMATGPPRCAAALTDPLSTLPEPALGADLPAPRQSLQGNGQDCSARLTGEKGHGHNAAEKALALSNAQTILPSACCYANSSAPSPLNADGRIGRSGDNPTPGKAKPSFFLRQTQPTSCMISYRLCANQSLLGSRGVSPGSESPPQDFVQITRIC